MKKATSRLILQTSPTAAQLPQPRTPLTSNHIKLGYQAFVRPEKPYDNPYQHPLPVHLNGSSFLFFVTTTQPHINCAHAVKGITTAEHGTAYYDDVPGSLVVKPPTHTRLTNIKISIDLDVKSGERSGIMSAVYKAFHDQDEILRQCRSMYCVKVEDILQIPGSVSSDNFRLTLDYAPTSTNLWAYGFQPPNKVIGVIVFSCDLETKEAGLPSPEESSFKVIIDYEYEFYNLGTQKWYYITPLLASLMPDCTLYYSPRRMTVETSRFLYGLDLLNLNNVEFSVARRGDVIDGKSYKWGFDTLCVKGQRLPVPKTNALALEMLTTELARQIPAIAVVEITASARAVHTSGLSSDCTDDEEFEVV